jgi:hypothetical protein
MTNNKANLFKNLIGNLSIECFFKNYWEKEVLYLEKKENPATNFPISVNDLDDYFTNTRLKYPWVKLVKSGIEVPLKEYRNTALSMLTDTVDNDKLFNSLVDGATILANSIDKSNKTIGIYCRTLEKELSLKVWANLYISGPKSTGIGIHQDAHDIFIIQLAGCKNWHMYPRDTQYTGPRQPNEEDKTEKSFLLKEGELVYLPKDYPHMAFSAGSPSVHLAISMQPLIWSDLIKSFAKMADEGADFQHKVPLPLEGKQAYQSFLNAFQEKWKEFNQTHHPLDFVQELNSGVNHQKNGQKQTRLSDWIAMDDIELDTILQKIEHVAYELKKQGKMIQLRFHNKRLNFPIFVVELLEHLLQEEPYKLRDIDCQQGDMEKIALAKKLVKEGILTIIEKSRLNNFNQPLSNQAF